MANNSSTHPIYALARQINEQGMMVFGDIRQMPVYNEPFTTPYMIIGLNLQGWVTAECDMRSVRFEQHDISVLLPRHILCAHESSDDYHAMLIIMSPKFQDAKKRQHPEIYHDNFFYLSQQDISLTDEQFATVLQLFQMIQTTCGIDSPNRWHMLGDLLEVLFLLLQNYRHQNGIPVNPPTPHEELFNQFYEAITQYYQDSREVRFYAELFHLSPKHFATIIKQLTQINALEWINNYVLLQAKQLLRYRRQLTIQEISIRLGFTEQASFSRFFKKKTGLSPSDYRDQD